LIENKEESSDEAFIYWIEQKSIKYFLGNCFVVGVQEFIKRD